jgi:hypothetical protein
MTDPDPVVEAYKRNLDRTLIRENLKRTVTERFENLMALQRFAEEMRRAGIAARKRSGHCQGA